MSNSTFLLTGLLGLFLVSICPEATAQFGQPAWLFPGNSGTGCNTSPCLYFVGTTDNSSLEIHVNSQRAYRIEPATSSSFFTFAPNIIGRFSGNNVTPGAGGATIARG